MENIIMLILGVFISVVGIVNINGNDSTIHNYKSCWNRNTDYRNISCIRLYCFVLERRNYGIYHSSSSYCRIRLYIVWTVQIQ